MPKKGDKEIGIWGAILVLMVVGSVLVDVISAGKILIIIKVVMRDE